MDLIVVSYLFMRQARQDYATGIAPIFSEGHAAKLAKSHVLGLIDSGCQGMRLSLEY
jgi:hypothetical protein